MDYSNKNTPAAIIKRSKHFLLFLMISLFLSTLNISVNAQTSDSVQTASTTSVAKDTSVKPNKAISLVFKELKKEDSIWQTFAMIAGVLVIVGIAMYISFKDSGKESKA